MMNKSIISFSRMDLSVIKSITREKKKPPKKLVFPRREPSTKKDINTIDLISEVSSIEHVQIPKESTFEENKIQAPCNNNPETLYALCANIVDSMKFPNAITWTAVEVRAWVTHILKLPQYADCFTDNHVTGKRLMDFKDPSLLPKIGITDWTHILRICQAIRKLFGTEFYSHVRSIGLPHDLPLTICTAFKAKTGPPKGIRETYTRSDILRLNRILNPTTKPLDHWDLVWYQKPEFPKVMLGRVRRRHTPEKIPSYIPKPKEKCYEYTVPRKFRIQNITPSNQTIWVDKRHYGPLPKEPVKKKKPYVRKIPEGSNLIPKKIDITGLTGKDLILARRKMPNKQFWSFLPPRSVD